MVIPYPYLAGINAVRIALDVWCTFSLISCLAFSMQYHKWMRYIGVYILAHGLNTRYRPAAFFVLVDKAYISPASLLQGSMVSRIFSAIALLKRPSHMLRYTSNFSSSDICDQIADKLGNGDFFISYWALSAAPAAC